MTKYEMEQVQPTDKNYQARFNEIKSLEKRKTAQYLGEGVTFFLLIVAGAVFVFRAVRRELRISRQQQNFMIAITHELKTPIAVAKLNLETMQKRKLDETQQQRLIQTTLEETNRLNALCNNMLLSSQIEAGGYRITNEETNLSELISNCVQDFIRRYPQQKIETSITPDIFISGDRLLLQMLANNLMDNAIKYGAKESPVTVLVLEENNKIKYFLVLRTRVEELLRKRKKRYSANFTGWAMQQLKPPKEPVWAFIFVKRLPNNTMQTFL